MPVSDRCLEAADKTFEFLASMPEIGSRWESANPALTALLAWPVRGFKKHLIFYRSTEDRVEIVRVLHAARDLQAILDSE